MNFTSFLRSRRAYLSCFVITLVLLLTVVQLDLWLAGASLRLIGLPYLLILGLAGVGLYLWLDFRRQRQFWGHLASLTGKEPLDELGVLPDPVTPEQTLLVEAWELLYSRLRAELNQEQERGHRNISLISQWAHHMKTPVAVIDLELQRAGEGALLSIGEENQRLSHSLQMLLNMVRLEEFTLDFKVETVELAGLVRGLINDQRREFIAHRVYPKVEADGAFYVQTDAKWFRFVLEQLLHNAVKYAARPEGEGRVVVRLYPAEHETVVEIADDGIGIAREDLPRLFQPFFTGNNGRAYPQSTGMGLYLAKEVCDRLGHSLTIKSERGVGTWVGVRVPVPQTLFSGLLTPSLTKL